MYSGPLIINTYITMSPQSSFNGGLISEETTQYEVGFRQLFRRKLSVEPRQLSIKTLKSLVNVEVSQYQRSEGGEVLNAIGISKC